MKRKHLALILALLIAISLFSACSAASAPKAAMDYYSASSSYASNEMKAQAPAAEAPAEMAMPSEAPAPEPGANGDAVSDGGQVDMSEKIIYSMDASIETLDFDASIEKVTELLERFGGFIENSSVSGIDYYNRQNGYTVTRYASFTLRVPSANYSGMTESLSEIGNVTNRSSYAENITTEFYDSQSRLNTYRTEEERLLAMLDKVEDVESMIAIEERLSDVRYQIESLETKLQNWQRQVDYSTVNLGITEVAELTEEKPVVRTYWQQVSDGFSGSLAGIGSFFKNLFKDFLTALPVLVLLAVAAFVIFLIVRAIIKKSKAREEIKRKAWYEAQEKAKQEDK